MKILRGGIPLLLTSLIVVSGTGGGYFWYRFTQQQELRELRRREWTALKAALEEEIVHFKGTTGIIVKDLETGWEFTLKKDRKFPAASMVKLPLMLAVYDSVHGGAVTLQDELILKGRHKVGGSGRLKALPSGRSFTVEELVSLMISASDNAATNMLIERIDFRPLNRWFDDFGLRDTNLGRMMMDFRFRRKGVENYTSARDVSLVLERLYRGEFIDKEFSGRCLGHLMEQKTKNRIPAFLPEDTPVAHKTGLERGVCHDAGIVYTPQGDFLVCVLTQGAPSHKNAKRFIGRIAATVYDYYVTKTDS